MAYPLSRLWIFGQPKPRNVPTDSNEDLLAAKKEEDSKKISENVGKQAGTDKDHSPPTFYAVSLLSTAVEDTQRLLVFTDKIEALNAVKKHDGARFKTFRDKQEAIVFASQFVEVSCATPKTEFPLTPPLIPQDKHCSAVSEKPSLYKAPKSQDSVLLRKAIMAGDAQRFKDTVWGNPRYLVSSGDTPVILQEGFRYNALHVAAKHKQPELCQLILSTIENPTFMELLYADDAANVRHQRILYLTDLYLNMPDKRLCETPLHFASKFGCLEAVRILASHPACDKNRPNKYGLKAREIICERCPSSSSELKKKIDEAFEAHYFVPVLRSSDNSVQPSIGKPCFKQDIDLPPPAPKVNSPHGSVVSVMAYAGPMSPEQANIYYKRLKTPPINFSRAQYEEMRRIRLCDAEKGLERFGRDLAQSMRTQWTEYWPSLNCWCDLSATSGLDILESHLRNLYYKLRAKEEASHTVRESNNSDIATDCSTIDESFAMMHSTPSNNSSCDRSSNSSGITSMCNKLENFHCNSSNSPNIPSACKTPFSWRLGSVLGDMNNHEDGISIEGCLLPSSPAVFPRFINNKEQTKPGTPNGLITPSKSVEDSLCAFNTTPKSKGRRMRRSLSNSFSSYVFTEPKENLFFSFTDNAQANCIKELFSKGNTQKLQLSVKSLIECIVEMFMAMTLNSELCDEIKIHELMEDLHPEVLCLLRVSQTMEDSFSRIHSFIAQQVYSDMTDNFLEDEQDLVLRSLLSYLEHYTYLDTFEDVDTLRGKFLRQHLKCVLKSVCSFLQAGIKELCSCDCRWTLELVPKTKFNAWGDSNGYRFKFSSPLDCDSLDEDSEDFRTPPSSPNQDCDSSDEEAVTPNEGLEVFVEGQYPSKADVDILRAVEKVQLDSVQYPHISRWKHLVLSKDKAVVDSWPSPALNHSKWKNQISRSLCLSPISPLAFDCTSPRGFKKMIPFSERLKEQGE